MSDPEVEIVGDSKDGRRIQLGDRVLFEPTQEFQRATGLPKVLYAAVCIGVQKKTKEPILRIFNPASNVVGRNVPTRSRGRRFRGAVAGFSFEVDPKEEQSVTTEDWTVWCDSDKTFGDWFWPEDS